jgi:Helix-turn-helix family
VDALDLARRLAGPAQQLGLSFYFDTPTRARAHELGLNAVEFYGLGRGGVLGDVGVGRVLEVFAFFSPGAVEAIWTAPKARCAPVATARAYIEAAYDFADRTFGALDRATLGFVGQGARRVAEGAAPGEAPLAEGYLALADPVDPVHQGYLGAILLRELRGGVYANAVRAAGLDGRAVTFLDSPDDFALHGFALDDAPVVTEELRARRLRAEAATDERMGALLGVLDGSFDDFARGVEGMLAALAEPVAVER